MAELHADSGVLYQHHVRSGVRGALSSKYVVLCCLIAAIGGFSFGYDQGVVSVILVMPTFLHRFSEMDATVTPNAGFWVGLATSMLELGGVIGALCQSWIADKFSRRRAMQAGVVVFVVGAIIQTAAQNYAALTVGRFIGGFGVGMLAMVAPVYMGEISPAEIRGTLLVLEEWCIVVGAIVAYWISFGTRFMSSEWSFRLPFLLQIFPTLFLGIAVFWMPFSPRWLASKGRDQEALATLSKLRGLPEDDPKVLAEYHDVVADAIFHRELLSKKHSASEDRTEDLSVMQDISAFLDLFKWLLEADLRRSRTGLLSGILGHQRTIGLSYDTSLLMAGIMNVLQLVGVTASIPLMDYSGRKPLLMFGGVGMLASQLCLAIIVGLYSTTWATHAAQGWVGVAFIFWYMIAFGISWGPIPWSMPAEIFPSSLRAKGTAFSQASQWFFNFVVGLVTPPMIQNIGYGTYVFFAVFCLLSFVWAWALCPETKQKTLEEMDALFGDNRGQLDEERKRVLRDELRHNLHEPKAPRSPSFENEKAGASHIEVV